MLNRWENAWENAYLSPNPCAQITVAVCFLRAGTTRGAAVAMFKGVYGPYWSIVISYFTYLKVVIRGVCDLRRDLL